MKFGMQPLNEITEKIFGGGLRYADTIIIGDASQQLICRQIAEW